MLKEGNDIDSVDASVGTAITSMEAEDGGSERITRRSGRGVRTVYRISSEKEEAMSTTSIGSLHQGQARRSTGGKDKGKMRKHSSTGDEVFLDLTEKDEDTVQGNPEKAEGRGKGLNYKLPNKIAQDNRRNKIDYGLWTAQELKNYAGKMLENIDTARMKCSKLQGVIDGIFKNRTLGLKDIIECLVEKVEAQGDINLLQKERVEALTENKRLKKEIVRLEQEKAQKDKEVEGIRSMYEEVEEKYIRIEKLREKERKSWSVDELGKEESGNIKETLRDTYELIGEERPVFRPPLKGISKELIIGSPRLNAEDNLSRTSIETPRRYNTGTKAQIAGPSGITTLVKTFCRGRKK